ncbi:ABC transporter substrate-binding protein [Oscillatoria sp. FACHB-1407]|uniref:ABC transporter substrate-binding protein n=1 Tax=Oscillatoria sp. FACHB-1407 TaxID=2692847 RepID=UPI001686A38B|nr:ABC transporter substrate-binding protein [Oscillatoria sp. FACHB-1407]MBD2463549.1 ABC transporter substrate-binding protein [Oscillatoria sp. FACHB-1407]
MPHLFSRRSFIRSSALATASTLITAGCSRHNLSSSASSDQPIRLGLNLWPGAIPWQIAEEQELFKAAGINAEILWFQVLGDQINAFNAGKIDIANLTLNDLFMSNSNGVPCKLILMPDVSAGADAIVASNSINSVQDFVGKQAGVEVATIGHLLFLQALAHNGIDPQSVPMVNMAADAAIGAIIAGKLDVAYSYDPFITQLLNSGKGNVVFSSKDVPGLIADTVVAQQSLLDHRSAEVQKLVDVWHQVLDFRNQHQQEAYAIEAKRAGVSVEDYATLQKGLEWLTPQQTLETFKPGDTTRSLLHAGKVVADFMVEQKLLQTTPPDIATLIDNRFMQDYVSRHPA